MNNDGRCLAPGKTWKSAWFNLPARRWVCLVASLLFAGRAGAVEIGVDWPAIDFAQITTNVFHQPTSITHAGDGSQRLFVTARLGVAWIIQDEKALAEPFLDIRDRVLSTGVEQGLLSLAFPPGFPKTSHFYAYYTRRQSGALTISRFGLLAESGLADPTSERVILAIPTANSIHNGGQLAFGPDGYLYIGVGDGGSPNDSENNSQNPTRLLGKLLRVDVEGGAATYAIPPGNPFVGRDGYQPEIWATGLRNPWRFSFDRLTGDLFIGDVGQDRVEEINFQAAGSPGGQNYGWRLMEGTNKFGASAAFTNFSALTPPVASYDHGTNASSVTGGHVYRGPSKALMDGVYFYGDFQRGVIWALKAEGTNWLSHELYRGASPKPGMYASAFGEGDDGRLYMADYFKGRIYEIRDSGRTLAPAFSPLSGVINSNRVMVTCADTNATIHFTTNGTAPTEGDPVIEAGSFLEVSSGVTNKLRAFRADLDPSEVTEGVFYKVTGTPMFDPPGGNFTNSVTLTISSVTPGARMFYSTDGRVPTTNSTPVTGPILITSTRVVRVLAVADGFSPSLVVTTGYSQAATRPPVFTPGSGPITNGTLVAISCATPGATVYYTLDGNLATTNSPVYTAPVPIDGGTTVSAYAVTPGYLPSTAQVLYPLAITAFPTFKPAPGIVSYGAQIVLRSATPGATIHYTTNGKVAKPNSAVYQEPIPVYGEMHIMAMAVAPGHMDSEQRSAIYTLPKAEKPEVADGPFLVGQLVPISSSASNAIIRFTLDGTDPGPNSAVYTTPLVFTNVVTLRARVYAPQLSQSDVLVRFLGLLEREATVVATFAGNPQPGFTNAVGGLARFNRPSAITPDRAGGFYVADSLNHQIRRLGAAGEVSSFAGTGEWGHRLGSVMEAQFNQPAGVTVDRLGNVWVTDCLRVCKIDTNLQVTRFYDFGPCGGGIPAISQIERDGNDNTYVGFAQTLMKIPPDGQSAVIAANGARFGFVGPVGLAIDPSGAVYMAAGLAVHVSNPQGAFEVFIGDGPSFTDGPRLRAGLEGARDVAFEAAGQLVVSDTTRIRRVRPDGLVRTLAGAGTTGYRNGRGSVAQFGSTAGLCVDAAGNIYVADSANNCIRKISPDTAGIGIADDWQMARFGRVGIDPNDDPDRDGLGNYGEFWAGTDPLNAASVLAMERPLLLPNGGVQIRWQTVAGKPYQAQFSNDLATWNNLSQPVVGDGSAASVIDPGQAIRKEQTFYRVILADM